MSRVFVAGHTGLLGSAICRRLECNGVELLTAKSGELDLRDQAAVGEFFSSHTISQVYLAAAKVGGIEANRARPAEFIRDNLLIQANVIHSAWESGVEKLLFLGSSCIYPRLAPQPIREDSLLTGELEPTNQWYAIAKIAGLKMCEAYRRQYSFDCISAMPTNLYGPGDNFELESSHVLPALIRKFHEAGVNGEAEVTIWGSGKPRREFMHANDVADACVFLMSNYSSSELVNVGWGKDISIRELAELVSNITGYQGRIRFDQSRPDGTPRKLLDTSRISALGWQPSISLEEGIRGTYDWYRARH